MTNFLINLARRRSDCLFSRVHRNEFTHGVSSTADPSMSRMMLFGIALLVLCAWLFVGYSYSYLDEEWHIEFFIKKAPTFKVEFYNPDASEADKEPFNQLSEEKQKAVLDYCVYRYGFKSSAEEAIETCRK